LTSFAVVHPATSAREHSKMYAPRFIASASYEHDRKRDDAEHGRDHVFGLDRSELWITGRTHPEIAGRGPLVGKLDWES
jgi:hypothetical protein